MDNSSLSTSFDFNSQAGVMAVLTAIRTSSISSADKNELRDLVFLYTNGGGDPSVRLALEAKIRSLNISPTAPAVAVKEEVKSEPTPVAHPFGTSRPLPVFAAPKLVPNSVPSPKAAAAAPAPASTTLPPVTETTQVKEILPKEEVVFKPEPVVAVPTPAPMPVAEPVIVKEVPKVEVAKEANQIPSTDTDTSKYLERIREIKSVVNGKVGNPVNLVDINNEVGREYMNALLDAMKRLSGGAGQIEPAMARLELAFASVLTAIDANERSKTIPKAEPEVQSSVPVEPRVETAPVVQKEVIPPVVKMEVADVVTVEAKPAEPVSGFDAPVVKEPVVEVKSPEAPKATEVVKPVPVVQTAQSVSDVPRMLTPEDLPSPASLETSTTGDPLFTREVDDGLEQLLSDWVLFKKSGLFGTGPKGREHPLFNKIAGLQIPLLLAGRFEGSTQEIKQSITDYMNGWRYEQGIIYEQGETFEHYLRRVIKQILDLQKKRRNT